MVARLLLYAAALFAATSPTLAQIKTFKDPGPPTVRTLAKTEHPKPTEYEGWTSGTAPKPLHPDAKTASWPTFLGPRHNGRCAETHLLREWPAKGPTLVWSMRRGEGYASPVIQGDYVVFTHRLGNQVHIDCLHAETGKRFWRFTYPSDYLGQYISNSGPRATAVISGGAVFVHGIQGSLHCLELATGRTRWKRDLAKELNTPEDFFGVVSSPLIHGNLLIQQLGAKNGPCVAAFDIRTGKMVWGVGDKWSPSCTSPVIGKVHGRDRVFVLAGGDSRPPTGGLLVIDPRTGKLDFEHPFRSKLYTSVTGATPLVGDNWVFLTSSYGVGSEVLSLAADGSFKSAWKNRRIAVQFSNPILKDGHIYAIDGKSDRTGAIVCIDPKNGSELSRTELNWDERITFGDRQLKYGASIGEGSLLIADGDVLCLGDNGHLLWLDVTSKRTKVLARAWLFRANESWTPLAISRGLLYVCQNNPERFGKEPARLLCYDLRRGK